MRKLAVLIGTIAATVFFVIPAAAGAGPATVFDGAVSCAVKSGQTRCGTGAFKRTDNRRSTVKSFDGVPIDVNVAFPKPSDSPWGEGPYPLVMGFHGWGQGKVDFTKAEMQQLLTRGYAVFSQTNRGFHESCGTAGAKAADPICEERGYLRLDDSRYEVRDAQYFSGMLVDEGLVQPDRLAAVGPSYGGGMSMALAALKDRVMLPDGAYAPWESPQGTPMSLAVASPSITWSDLAYSLFPNGSTLDYLADSPYSGSFGVMKESLVNGLFLGGLLAPGYYSEADPDADLPGWIEAMSAGEPYADVPGIEATLTELTTYHSSYYIDHSQPPAPMLISAGFTDDLFPASETLRFYNRSRSEHPDSPMGLFLGPIGGGLSHARGQNKAGVNNAQTQLTLTWLDHYLADVGEPPASDVTAFTQTCPNSAVAAGPFMTGDWVSQSPGEIRYQSEAAQTVSPEGGTVAVSTAFRPDDGVKPCVQVDGAAEPGTASYEVDPAPADGYMLMGSPTVIADIEAPGGNSTLAARLVDVSPNGQKKLLVARALWRPATSGLQVFQLNPNGWQVKTGHVLRLELLPHEQGEGASYPFFNNYGRVSNDQQPVTVSELELRIPVQESPGSLDGVVSKPAPKVLPDRPGVELASGYDAIGSQTIAEYQLIPSSEYTLTVNKTGNGTGTVSAAPAPIDGSYTDGTEVTLTATPGAGFTFEGWTGCAADGNDCVITVTGDSTVSAQFDAVPSGTTEPFAVSFNEGVASFGSLTDVTMVTPANPSTVEGVRDTDTGDLTIAVEDAVFPSRPFDLGGGTTGTISFYARGNGLKGRWNGSSENGNLMLRGLFGAQVEVESDAGSITCVAKSTLRFSTERTIPYRGARFVDGLEGEGAVVAAWDDLGQLKGGEGCGDLAPMMAGPGGMWLSHDIAAPPVPPVPVEMIEVSAPTLHNSADSTDPVTPGRSLTCEAGQWDNYSQLTFAWFRNGIEFDNNKPNGTGRTSYHSQPSDAGSSFTCAQTARAHGSTTWVTGTHSNAMDVIAP